MANQQQAKATLTLALIAVLVTSSSLVTSRPASSSKKPPFNGSIFGKRSTEPAIVASNDLEAYYPLGSANGAFVSTPAYSAPDFNYAQILLAIQQQQQQQQDANSIGLAISRCLALRSSRQNAKFYAKVAAVCDELLTFAELSAAATALAATGGTPVAPAEVGALNES